MPRDNGGIFGFGILTGNILHQTEKPEHIKYSDYPDVINFYVITGYTPSNIKHPVPFSPQKLADEFNRLAGAMQQGLRIEQYTSTLTKAGWKTIILAEYPGERFEISFVTNAKDHRKVDAFFNSIRFAGYELESARASGNAITLTRKRGSTRKYQPQQPPSKYRY